MNQTQQTQESIDLCAANWVARMIDGGLNDAEHKALDAWLAQSRSHQQAFADANHALAMMDASLFSDGVNAAQSSMHEADRQNAEIRPFPVITGKGKKPPRTGIGKWAAIALAACLLIALFSGRVLMGDPALVWGADYHTAPGEIRTITLDDGSKITLGPDSAIDVKFSEQERRIEIFTGLVDFQAVPMENAGDRPFVVSTGDGIARALGTRFVIDKFDDYASVSVLQHNVKVSLTNGARPTKSLVLSPNEAVRYSRYSLEDIYPVNSDRVLSWQKGKLIFDRVALREVVAEFSRYQHGKILIANEAVARKRVSGVFDMSDPQVGLDLIATELSIRKVSITPLLTFLY
ncbi:MULTISPECIES: FecR family protein [Thalassospira]|uniref:FecR family protein n=1 Tax=Thalassospira xiamenensis TaxID=220697 RepID=A0ABR5Y205_9PROT|nr:MULTISPECIES: FecR domain-containing protein [Thalassospira]MAL29794.1 hypothetical protein [Thalassospira sp.]MBR9782308.1 DUF4880 domain-containing protein [Rhodospirillales bacterium]KZD03435.1 hypothetical protein AUP40_17450 [Thalassospira xiamenensis]KZD09000.1 hypothetical protein AUP45_15025 [Thalassospira xiamenensis]MBL4841297.1 FecR domain-containing protein [Thalassospira sp.]